MLVCYFVFQRVAGELNSQLLSLRVKIDLVGTRLRCKGFKMFHSGGLALSCVPLRTLVSLFLVLFSLLSSSHGTSPLCLPVVSLFHKYSSIS